MQSHIVKFACSWPLVSTSTLYCLLNIVRWFLVSVTNFSATLVTSVATHSNLRCCITLKMLHNLSFGAHAFRVSAPKICNSLYLFTSANPERTHLSDVNLSCTTFTQPFLTRIVFSFYPSTFAMHTLLLVTCEYRECVKFSVGICYCSYMCVVCRVLLGLWIMNIWYHVFEITQQLSGRQ